MKKIIIITVLLLGIAGTAIWYFQRTHKSSMSLQATSSIKNLEQSLKLKQFKARGYYYLSQKNTKDALIFLKMASELDPSDSALKEAIKELETNKTPPNTPETPPSDTDR